MIQDFWLLWQCYYESTILVSVGSCREVSYAGPFLDGHHDASCLMTGMIQLPRTLLAKLPGKVYCGREWRLYDLRGFLENRLFWTEFHKAFQK